MNELLVVLAFVAVLAGILAPALAKAKAKARAVNRLSNMRQLSLAWQQYAYDNSEHIPFASSVGPVGDPQIDPYVWVDRLPQLQRCTECNGGEWRLTGVTPRCGKPIDGMPRQTEDVLQRIEP